MAAVISYYKRVTVALGHENAASHADIKVLHKKLVKHRPTHSQHLVKHWPNPSKNMVKHWQISIQQLINHCPNPGQHLVKHVSSAACNTTEATAHFTSTALSNMQEHPIEPQNKHACSTSKLPEQGGIVQVVKTEPISQEYWQTTTICCLAGTALPRLPRSSAHSLTQQQHCCMQHACNCCNTVAVVWQHLPASGPQQRTPLLGCSNAGCQTQQHTQIANCLVGSGACSPFPAKPRLAI
jgi:hypothetical protein